MGNDTEIVFYEGISRPVKCSKIKYYKDSTFTQRVIKPVKVPKLTIEEEGPMPSKTQNTVSAVAAMALAACAVQPMATPPAQAAPQEVSQRAKAALAQSAAPEDEARVQRKASADAMFESMFPLTGSPDHGRALVAKVFAMAIGLQQISALTRARVERETGILFLDRMDGHVVEPKLEIDSPDYFWSERITENFWTINLNFADDAGYGRPKLALGFLNPRNTRTAMSPICFDFYELSVPLVLEHGYKMEVVGEDAKHVNYLIYSRPEIAGAPIIELHPAYELPRTPGDGDTCIAHLVIR